LLYTIIEGRSIGGRVLLRYVLEQDAMALEAASRCGVFRIPSVAMGRDMY
jgi:hypothetical protein